MATQTKAQAQSHHPLQHWRCHHHPDRSEIAGYVEASGKWERVAVVSPTTGTSAKDVAEFIVRTINAGQKNQDLLRDATRAVEAMIEEGLNFSTEQDAEAILKRMKGANG